MKSYIDQALAVCDALIAQAKTNKETYHSVFAPVSENDERARITSQIEAEAKEDGAGVAELKKEAQQNLKSLVMSLKPDQVRTTENAGKIEILLNTLTEEQRFAYDEWRLKTSMLGLIFDMSNPEHREEY